MPDCRINILEHSLLDMIETPVVIPYEDMLGSGMHFGRKRAVFHPGMKDYVFTVRDGICIIDLLKTQAQLRYTIEFFRKVIAQGGIILFVALTKQSVDAMKGFAEALGMPFVIDRWLGGTLTNFKIINSRVKRLEELEASRASGGFEKYTKKERLMFERELDKMRTRFGGLRKLTRVPDVVFVSSLRESGLPVKEARQTGATVAGIANTDANPTDIDYVVPANDRSKKSIDLIIGAMQKELAP